MAKEYNADQATNSQPKVLLKVNLRTPALTKLPLIELPLARLARINLGIAIGDAPQNIQEIIVAKDRHNGLRFFVFLGVCQFKKRFVGLRMFENISFQVSGKA